MIKQKAKSIETNGKLCYHKQETLFSIPMYSQKK